MMSSEVVDSRGRSYADLCLRIGSLDSCYFSGSKYLDLSSSNLTLFHHNIEQEIENELSSVISKAETDAAFTLRNMKSCGTPHRKVKIIGDERRKSSIARFSSSVTPLATAFKPALSRSGSLRPKLPSPSSTRRQNTQKGMCGTD